MFDKSTEIVMFFEKEKKNKKKNNLQYVDKQTENARKYLKYTIDRSPQSFNLNSTW